MWQSNFHDYASYILLFVMWMLLMVVIGRRGTASRPSNGFQPEPKVLFPLPTRPTFHRSLYYTTLIRLSEEEEANRKGGNGWTPVETVAVHRHPPENGLVQPLEAPSMLESWKVGRVGRVFTITT